MNVQYQLQRISKNAAPVVSLAKAKEHLRVSHASDDTYITALLTSAEEYVERHLRRALVEQVWELRFTELPCLRLIPLDWPTVRGVVSFKYLDLDRVEQTLDPLLYRLVQVDEFQQAVLPATPETDWPNMLVDIGAIKVRFTTGYAPDNSSPLDYTANIPLPIKQAILMMIGELYENREASIVGTNYAVNPTVMNLLQSYRAMEL